MRPFVRALLDQSAIDIRNRDGANQVRNFISGKAVRISGPVKIFVVMQDHVEHLGVQSSLRTKRLVTELGMSLHDGSFLLGELGRLFQNVDWNLGLAEVVQ